MSNTCIGCMSNARVSGEMANEGETAVSVSLIPTNHCTDKTDHLFRVKTD